MSLIGISLALIVVQHLFPKHNGLLVTECSLAFFGTGLVCLFDDLFHSHSTGTIHDKSFCGGNTSTLLYDSILILLKKMGFY